VRAWHGSLCYPLGRPNDITNSIFSCIPKACGGVFLSFSYEGNACWNTPVGIISAFGMGERRVWEWRVGREEGEWRYTLYEATCITWATRMYVRQLTDIHWIIRAALWLGCSAWVDGWEGGCSIPEALGVEW
jgi:hypothetical protein